MVLFRYPNLNCKALKQEQVKHLYTRDGEEVEVEEDVPAKRARNGKCKGRTDEDMDECKEFKVQTCFCRKTNVNGYGRHFEKIKIDIECVEIVI